MTPVQLLENFNALPADAQRVVIELVELLSKKELRTKPAHRNHIAALTNEKFIGIWKDRIDMQDSAVYIRNLRSTEWS